MESKNKRFLVRAEGDGLRIIDLALIATEDVSADMVFAVDFPDKSYKVEFQQMIEYIINSLPVLDVGVIPPANNNSSSDTGFGGFRYTFDETTRTLNLFTN